MAFSSFFLRLVVFLLVAQRIIRSLAVGPSSLGKEHNTQVTQASNGNQRNKLPIFFKTTYSENFPLPKCQNTQVPAFKQKTKRAFGIYLLADSKDILPSLGASCQTQIVKHRNIWRKLDQKQHRGRQTRRARVTKMTELIRGLKNREQNIWSQHPPQTLTRCLVSHLHLSQGRTSNQQLTPEK